MKSTELRIGNWIESPVVGWAQINVKGIQAVANGKHKYKPIPLTEEWLVKFGLYNNLKVNYNKRQGVEYRFSKKKLGTYIIKRYCNCSLYSMQFVYDDKHNNIPNEQIWVNIKHVHQLQNLYFALTGEELTIKKQE